MMTLTPKGQLYVVGVSAVGLVVIGHCVAVMFGQPVSSQWLILAGLTLFSGSFTIKVPSLRRGCQFQRLSYLLRFSCLGPARAPSRRSGHFGCCVGRERRSREPLRLVFNLTSAAISIWAAGTAFYLSQAFPPSRNRAPTESVPLPQLVLSAGCANADLFHGQQRLVAIAVAIERNGTSFCDLAQEFLVAVAELLWRRVSSGAVGFVHAHRSTSRRSASSCRC